MDRYQASEQVSAKWIRANKSKEIKSFFFWTQSHVRIGEAIKEWQLHQARPGQTRPKSSWAELSWVSYERSRLRDPWLCGSIKLRRQATINLSLIWKVSTSLLVSILRLVLLSPAKMTNNKSQIASQPTSQVALYRLVPSFSNSSSVPFLCQVPVDRPIDRASGQ